MINVTGSEQKLDFTFLFDIFVSMICLLLSLFESSCFMAYNQFKVAFEAALKLFTNINLKEEQEICIRSLVLDRVDVLAVLPTGYGKSIIYQILAKVISGLRYNQIGERRTETILVVSPLKQIRKQQVERLNARGIKSASLEDVHASDDTILSEYEILFGSAEQWLSDIWLKNLECGYLNKSEVLVVDDIHTIQTW
mgnify:FL=1